MAPQTAQFWLLLPRIMSILTTDAPVLVCVWGHTLLCHKVPLTKFVILSHPLKLSDMLYDRFASGLGSTMKVKLFSYYQCLWVEMLLEDLLQFCNSLWTWFCCNCEVVHTFILLWQWEELKLFLSSIPWAAKTIPCTLGRQLFFLLRGILMEYQWW